MNIKRWLTGIGVIAFLSVSTMIIADQADTLDLHSNVKEAVGIADDRFQEDALRVIRAIRFIDYIE